MREVMVIRSVTICEKRRMVSECEETDVHVGVDVEGREGEGREGGNEVGLTRLSNVLRFPTNTMSPSMK